MNFGLFVMMMGLAHVSCGNSRVRAAGICISTAVNIQFSPTSACCPAEWGEKGAVGSRDLCWLGGGEAGVLWVPWGHHTWISSGTHSVACQRRPFQHLISPAFSCHLRIYSLIRLIRHILVGWRQHLIRDCLKTMRQLKSEWKRMNIKSSSR